MGWVEEGKSLNVDNKYKAFKKHLGDLCGLIPEQLVLVEVGSATVGVGAVVLICLNSKCM